MSINQIHFFLWCSHGGTVSAENNLYDVETGVHSVMFYGDQFDDIQSDLLSSAFDFDFDHNNVPIPKFTHFKKLLTGCPTLSYQDIVNDSVVLKTLLPPMFFTVKETDRTAFIPNTNNKMNFTQIMGLYYFNITAENNTFRVNEHERIISWDDLKNKVYTYSLIFSKIKKFRKEKNIPLTEHAIVGLYACRSFMEEYSRDYLPFSLNYFVPTFANQNKHMPIDLRYTWNTEDTSIRISPCVINAPFINFQLQQGWSALAGLRHQGCALNVLSFFSILPQGRAREESVCLNIRGTSIIEICKYINDYLLRNNIYCHFIILRFQYDAGIENIFNLLYKSTFSDDVATIVKFYSASHHKQSGKTKFSNMGHTVAFGVYNREGLKIFYLVDPQAQLVLEAYNIDEITAKLKHHYKGIYQFMDIIFIIDNESNFSDKGRNTLNSHEVDDYINKGKITTPYSMYNDSSDQTDPNDQYEPTDPNDPKKIGVAEKDLAGGNKKRIKKTKKKSSKKNKSRRRRQYRGGDVFITMSKQIDKESNVESLIN